MPRQSRSYLAVDVRELDQAGGLDLVEWKQLRLLEFLRADMSCADIARLCDVSPAAVCRMLRRMAIPRLKRAATGKR